MHNTAAIVTAIGWNPARAERFPTVFDFAVSHRRKCSFSWSLRVLPIRLHNRFTHENLAPQTTVPTGSSAPSDVPALRDAFRSSPAALDGPFQRPALAAGRALSRGARCGRERRSRQRDDSTISAVSMAAYGRPLTRGPCGSRSSIRNQWPPSARWLSLLPIPT